MKVPDGDHVDGMLACTATWLSDGLMGMSAEHTKDAGVRIPIGLQKHEVRSNP